MPPEPGDRSAGTKEGPRFGFDPVAHLGAFLESPPPLTLLIIGESGSGKTLLSRSLAARHPGPRLFVAYRLPASATEPTAPRARELSLLIVDPAEGPAADAPPPNPGDLPAPLSAALDRLSTQGGGIVVVDLWDPETEKELKVLATDSARVHEVSGPFDLLRGRFGRYPVRTIVALSRAPDPELLSGADGIVELGWEDVEGARLRVLTLSKLRRLPPPETRYLYTVDRGKFTCPPQLATGFRPPIAGPEPDPAPEPGSLFPGSRAYAEAFGRLRYRGLTAIEVPPRFHSAVADAILFPMVAQALALGGRVVWIPSATTGPLAITTTLSRFLPPDFFRERLRVLHPGGAEAALGELRSVVIPIRTEFAAVREGRPTESPASHPLFPEAQRFLKETPAGRPALYVVYLDGLRALAAVGGITVTPETFAMIVGGYARLPTFHGIGFGRTDDPVYKPLAAVVDNLLHVESRYGRTVLYGIRPRTPPYILDWPGEGERYSLLPVR